MTFVARLSSTNRPGFVQESGSLATRLMVLLLELTSQGKRNGVFTWTTIDDGDRCWCRITIAI